MRSLFLVICISIATYVSAQNPGNIGTTNLTAWFKPDALTLGGLSSWTTTFPTGGGAITLTDIAAPYPNVVNTPLRYTSNYNKTIDFTGNISGAELVLQNTSALNLLDNNTALGTGTMLCVYYLPPTRTGHMVMYREGSSGSVDGIQFRNLGVSCRLALGTTDSPNGSRDYTESRRTELISYHGNKSGVGTMSLFQRSRLITTSVSSSTTGDMGLFLGARRTGTYNGLFDGFLCEVLFYNQNLTTLQYQKVNTYLAVKYGITLQNFGGGVNGDYVATNDSLIWDADLSSAYHNNVIGIGRDDDEALLQKQSHNFDDSARIYLNTLETNNDANTGTFINNFSYVMMGDNAGILCESALTNNEHPFCGLYTRLNREWKITKSNFDQDFNADFLVSTCASPSTISVGDIMLLVDDDGDFSTGSTQAYYNGDGSGITITYAGNVISVANIAALHIPNNSTKYITFIIRPIFTPVTANACASYTSPSGRFTWTSSGLYNDTLISSTACDSVLHITLNITPSLFDTIRQTICSNQFYTFNGVNINTTGVFEDTLTSIAACDSFITLILQVNPTSTGTINTTICSNQTYLFNGVNLNTTGTFIDTLTNLIGCDSVVTLNLVVNSTSASTINRTICSNQSYLFNGVNLNTSGTYLDTLINSRFCDSVITLNLSINSTSTGTINATICSNQNYLFNGINRNVAGTYLDTLINSVGCDSVVTLNLSVNSTSTGTINNTICSNQTYVFNGVSLNTSGTYLDTLSNIASCDSVITLNLSVLTTSASTITQSICNSSSYLFNGVNLTTSGTYKDTFISINGCDSVVTLNLTVLPVINTPINQILCNGSTYVFNGVTLSSSGTYKDTLLSFNGCDSILTLNLIILPILSGTINRTICDNQSYTFNGVALTSSGIYQDTLLNFIGCDSFVTLNLIVYNTSSSNVYDSICEGENYLFNQQVLTTSGLYLDTLQTIHGCDSLVLLQLFVFSNPTVQINAGNDTSIVSGSSISLNAYGAQQYSWSTGINGSTITITPTVSSSYYVIGTDSNNCSNSDTILVQLIELIDSSYIAVPTAFSPNGDGKNDQFKILGTYNFKVVSFMIFNRWGEKVFEAPTPEDGWDGIYKLRPQEIGTYVYVVKGLSRMSNDIRTYTGNITLIR